MSAWIVGGLTVCVVAGLIVRRWMGLQALLRLRLRQDPLTKLPNRTALEEVLGRAIANETESSSFALLVVGLSGFRRVNELYGYHLGDRFLIQIAERLRRAGGEQAVAVRLGGDEFALALMGNKNRETAERTAAAVRRAVDECSNSGFSKAGVTARVGISLFPGAVRDAEEALRVADLAMRQTARRAGQVQDRSIRELIRVALDQGGFRLVFQPVLDRNDLIVQMEALVRIHDQRLGVVPPDEFIGVAEETGLIHEMGRWILGEACRYAGEWLNAGQPVAVAVNVSVSQLAEAGLFGFVLQKLQEHGLHGSALVLEITESGGSPISEAGRAFLRAAKAAGIGISLDGLAEELRDADFVKVEFSKLEDRTPGQRIAVTCIEEVWQLERARGLACDLFQGYLIAPPLEPEDATQFLLARNGTPGHLTLRQ